MVKRLPNWLKIGVQTGFGPNFTVELEAEIPKNLDWPNVHPHKSYSISFAIKYALRFSLRDFRSGFCFEKGVLLMRKDIESHMFTTNGINKSIVQSLLCHRIPANQLRVEVNVIL